MPVPLETVLVTTIWSVLTSRERVQSHPETNLAGIQQKPRKSNSGEIDPNEAAIGFLAIPSLCNACCGATSVGDNHLELLNQPREGDFPF